MDRVFAELDAGWEELEPSAPILLPDGQYLARPIGLQAVGEFDSSPAVVIEFEVVQGADRGARTNLRLSFKDPARAKGTLSLLGFEGLRPSELLLFADFKRLPVVRVTTRRREWKGRLYCNVVLVGAGFESVYRRMLQPYKQVIRMGLATRGEVDLLSDICDMPLASEEVDAIISSSVMEHVYDPERAASEMSRVLKPGGYVYAEIPFMRAYHMIPVDYQRYTITGIEELFKRHGFRMVCRPTPGRLWTAANPPPPRIIPSLPLRSKSSCQCRFHLPEKVDQQVRHPYCRYCGYVHSERPPCGA